MNILDFWFDKKNQTNWFKKDENFDQTLKNFFENQLLELEKQDLNDLKSKNPEKILETIIIFDQIPRNIYRYHKDSFKFDNKALKLSKFAIENNLDQNLSPDQQRFLYIPLMHSENLDDQNLCIELFTRNNDDYSKNFAIKHQEIIKKFNRFPHRNQILDRQSTKEELLFLENHSGF